MRNILSISDLSSGQIWQIFKISDELLSYYNTQQEYQPLKGKTIILLFELSSLRTRVAFEAAIGRLGACSIYLTSEQIEMKKRESIEDISKVLSLYGDCIICRFKEHKDLEEFAKFATVPVINALTPKYHPCQIISDLYTIWKEKTKLIDINLVYIGDGTNNIANSLLLGAAMMGTNITIISPPLYQPQEAILEEANKLAMVTKSKIKITDQLDKEILYEADIIYTDVWTSMGKEEEKDKRKKIFFNYQVNANLVKNLREECLIMHCLPAHRGEEITDEVINSKQSIIYKQAKNKLIVQAAIILYLLT